MANGFWQKLYKAPRLSENLFIKIKYYRTIATYYDKFTFHFLSIIQLLLFGLVDDNP